MTDDRSLLEEVVETLPSELAVLDAEGTIRYTNAAWREFAAENGLVGDPATIGESYVDVTEAADDGGADEAARGIRALLAGECEEFTMEYPCHSPDERRWFMMHAKRLTHRGEPYVQVGHIDITERKLAELEVRESNERLEAVASVLGHDVRNPLAVATGYLDVLAEGFDGEPDALATVRTALERIEAIVDDALVLARGARAADEEAVSLGECAREAWSNVETGDARLSVEADRRLVADGSLLGNLLENLFRNAVEHGSTSPRSPSTHEDAVEHADPAVRVTVGATPDGFYVADDGPGIPEPIREQVFEEGVTTGDSGANAGLGLYIVRRIADAHGWSVAVTEGADGGARFEFEGVATPA